MRNVISKCLHQGAKVFFDYDNCFFSGIQPTGVMHLGNYFGAVEKWTKMQNANENIILSIVDLHSITVPKDPELLKKSVLHMTASLIACGIDTNKCILFQQSKVPYHTSLAWVLGTLTTATRLYHFPQYKEKSASSKTIPLGLLIYPVLQAADILLYKSTHVPIGEDNVQHLHLAQHLVHTFNNKFGSTFPIPECVVDENSGAGKIRNLKEPNKKMSKSHINEKTRIEITDSPDIIASKIKKSITDFTSEVTYDPEGRPGVSNLINIHALCSGQTWEEICEESVGIDTGMYKARVADAVVAKFEPIRNKLMELLKEPDYLEKVLNEGTIKALPLAEDTWNEVSSKIGFEAFSIKNKIKI